jgi:hypothetical protein
MAHLGMSFGGMRGGSLVERWFASRVVDESC